MDDLSSQSTIFKKKSVSFFDTFFRSSRRIKGRYRRLDPPKKTGQIYFFIAKKMGKNHILICTRPTIKNSIFSSLNKKNRELHLKEKKKIQKKNDNNRRLLNFHQHKMILPWQFQKNKKKIQWINSKKKNGNITIDNNLKNCLFLSLEKIQKEMPCFLPFIFL